MTTTWSALAARPLSRMVDRAFVSYARRRTRQLERLDVAAIQRATLQRLVYCARHTRFGREHDFAAIRSVADFQERVPLRDYDRFWQEYWQPSFPVLDNATWPGHIPYLALSSGTTTGVTKYLPVSRALLASHQRAARTALAWYRAWYPESLLFTGRLFFLGGSTDLQRQGPSHRPVLAGDLSGIVAHAAPAFLRPFVFPPRKLALLADWERKLALLAEQSSRLAITLVSGVPSWLLALFERLLQITGRHCIAEVWPTLRVVVHGGTRFDPYRPLFQQLIGRPDIHFLETYPASEGFVASEDPRHGLLRLITDHGIFFEFVPVAELQQGRPTRHTVDEVVTGVQYAVVLTTCAGLWSYILGDTICFEKRDPPLLRFTGRTHHFLSAFGEHLIGEEIEQAVADAAQATSATLADFHVGPVHPSAPGLPGRHRFLIEFVQPPADLEVFARVLDAALGRMNADYRAHRAGDLTLGAPQLCTVLRGGFTRWLSAHGRVGGQHKVPRIDGEGKLTAELFQWFADHACLDDGPGHTTFISLDV